MYPVQSGGTGFGAGVTLSFSTSVAWKPGHSPETTHGSDDVLSHSSWPTWISEAPEPGQTDIWAICLFTWPLPAAPTQCRSTLPSQCTIGGHGPPTGPSAGPAAEPPPGPPDLSAEGGSCA